MLEIPQKIWKKIPGYSKPSKVFRTNHENVLCWKTNRKEDRKPVVIKLFERDIIEEVTAEIKAAQSIHAIDHPNLIKILEVGEDDDIGVYYVMECWGADLRDTIRVKPDPKIALEIIKQVLEGLGELHKKVGAHRDIKPENIFLKGNQVKIGDYGLVKSQRYVTQLTTIAGTRDYMAPEVLAGKPYDNRCDIYSTGVVLRELLTGEQPPFTGAAPDEIVSKAMAKEPKDRFQTAEEFIKALTHRKDAEKETLISPLPITDINNSELEMIKRARIVNKMRLNRLGEPIFQKLDIQRYPPKPEMRGQDDPGLLVKTLQARLDELSKGNDYRAMLPITTELRQAVVDRFDIYNSRSADALDREAGIYLKIGDYTKSIELYKAALDTTEKLYGTPTKEMIGCYYNLAEAHRNFSGYQEAKPWYNLALSSSDKIFRNLPQSAIIRNNLSGVHYLLKEYPQCLKLLKEALTINEKQGRVSELVVINLYNMALTYEAMGNKGTAEPLYKQAKDTLAKLPPDKITLSEEDKQRILI